MWVTYIDFPTVAKGYSRYVAILFACYFWQENDPWALVMMGYVMYVIRDKVSPVWGADSSQYT